MFRSPDLRQGVAALVDPANPQAIPQIVHLHAQGLKRGPDIQDQSQDLGLNPGTLLLFPETSTLCPTNPRSPC